MKPTKRKWDPYTHITDLVIEGLEKGVGPWSKPWRLKPGMSDGLNGMLPFNPHTKSGGRAYNGNNAWLLAIKGMAYGWTDPRFCTFKQMKKGWRVKKDQSGANGGPGPSHVYFFVVKNYPKLDTQTGKPLVDSNGKPIVWTSFKPKMYRVWNFEQLDGPEAWVTEEDEATEATEVTEEETTALKHDLAWEVIEAWRQVVPTKFGGGRAFYVPSADRIQLPEYEAFDTEEDALCTEFHEDIHSTGHESREKRDFSGRFGNDAYAFEELVAELGAANLMAATGVVGSGVVREDHVQYLQHWIKVLKKDNRALFTASKLARQATERILNNAEKKEAIADKAAA